MPAAHSTNALVSPADRALMRRMTIALAALFLLTFAMSRLELLYSHKFYDVTGRAQWIWDNHRIAAGDPLAFFAAYDFDLRANRYYTKIKIAGDPQYTLYFNGVEIGGRRMGEESRLDVFDVTPLAKTGRNRIVVALRSDNGVGGLLAAVDLAPDYQNVVVTNRDWKIYRTWNDALPAHDLAQLQPRSPMLLGAPPMRRWNYLERADRAASTPVQKVIAPRASFTMRGALAEIKVVEGVAVTATKVLDATVYDFGPTHGRARFTILSPSDRSRPILVRFANDRSELAPVEGVVSSFVFAAGERTIVDPEERSFRYVMVYGGAARADVAQ
jgi:hypothetical protein